MSVAAPSAGDWIGPFAVNASAPEVAAFRQALGLLGAGPEVPLTFPMRWLAAPEVRAAILQRLGASADAALGDGPVLVHLEQEFHSVAPLRVGGDYAMAVAVDRAPQGGMMSLRADITDAERLCCRAVGRFAVVGRDRAGV